MDLELKKRPSPNGSVDSFVSLGKKLPECFFCSPDDDLIFFQTQNFNVVFDKYPLIPGHLIIHSKAHVSCAGELPPDLMSELLATKERISLVLNTGYGACAFYEHGRAGHCISSPPDERSCHHFHLHALPFTLPIQADLSNRFPVYNMGSFDEIAAFYNRFGEYLFYETPEGEMLFFPASRNIEPHLFRNLINSKLTGSGKTPAIDSGSFSDFQRELRNVWLKSVPSLY